jgi:hypothetical protein
MPVLTGAAPHEACMLWNPMQISGCVQAGMHQAVGACMACRTPHNQPTTRAFRDYAQFVFCFALDWLQPTTFIKLSQAPASAFDQNRFVSTSNAAGKSSWMLMEQTALLFVPYCGEGLCWTFPH